MDFSEAATTARAKTDAAKLARDLTGNAARAAARRANAYSGQPNRGAARAARIEADQTAQSYRFAQARYEQALRATMAGATEAEIQKAANA